MANDNHANYARIGSFIILGLVLILVTLIWLGGAGGNKNEIMAETFFPNDVSGLDVGSAVNLRAAWFSRGPTAEPKRCRCARSGC